MAKKPHELLAQSLKKAKNASRRGVVQTHQLARQDRERLEAGGWLTPIIRGWYLLRQGFTSQRGKRGKAADLNQGESIQWYSSFWDFTCVYLNERFGENYCLSAQASIDVHLGASIIPKQLLVIVKSGGSSVLKLPFDTSIMAYQETTTFPSRIARVNDLNVMPLALALHKVPDGFFRQAARDAEIALKLVNENALLTEALQGNNLAASNRLAGAYLFLGEKQRYQKMVTALTAAGYKIAPTNPFKVKAPILQAHPRLTSPYVARIKSMWLEMREDVMRIMPNKGNDRMLGKKYFSHLDKIYIYDAYNSLSIEGYEVSEQLIERIAKGDWQPESSLDDKEQTNAMAAKGYYQAFETVKMSIKRIFTHEDPVNVIQEDLYMWYAALFSPLVKAGIIKPEHLAGYRTHQVYIRNSMHTPLPCHALMDAMDAFFECLQTETHIGVRAILGHFILVYIHPFMDGNGRIARFILNALFASGGMPWTIIRVKRRNEYFKALEIASVKYDIKPFTKFILEEMKNKNYA